MKQATMPAPGRAGTPKFKTARYWRSQLRKLAHDEEALEIVARLVEKLTE